jgi:hypothetical protein
LLFRHKTSWLTQCIWSVTNAFCLKFCFFSDAVFISYLQSQLCYFLDIHGLHTFLL